MSAAPPPREPTRRLFFALWPKEEQRRALFEATHQAVSACGGRAVPVQNLHATLAFLGSVAERRIGELQETARRVALAFVPEPRPLSVHFNELAHWLRPQILVALSGAEAGAAGCLAAVLRSEAQAAGFSPDLKPFHAHVTLARKVARAPALSMASAVTWTFDAFALVQSSGNAEGAAYSVVQSYLLVKHEKAHGQPQN